MSSTSGNCIDYAKQNSIILLLLVIFSGVLIVPHFSKHIYLAKFIKTTGFIKTIYYSQYTPILSFVEITYNIGNKNHSIRRTIQQRIQVGDHIEIFVSPDQKAVVFKEPPTGAAMTFIAIYILILFVCLYSTYCVYTSSADNKKK